MPQKLRTFFVRRYIRIAVIVKPKRHLKQMLPCSVEKRAVPRWIYIGTWHDHRYSEPVRRHARRRLQGPFIRYWILACHEDRRHSLEPFLFVPVSVASFWETNALVQLGRQA